MNEIYIYICNWKSFLTYNQETDLAYYNKSELEKLANQATIVLCPSFVSLKTIKIILNESIDIGAQNCSEFGAGAYTGQISPESLAEIDCKYCIIGHYETRTYFNETDNSVAKKTELLLKNNITPIICIGETSQEHKDQKSLSKIDSQLELVINIAQSNDFQDKEIIVAYEPIWSIGTGIIPELNYIDRILSYIKEKLNKTDIKFKLIYGGSVNSINISELKQSQFIEGFLIGKATTDFQELKKIVLS